jgi:hypothetical protein
MRRPMVLMVVLGIVGREVVRAVGRIRRVGHLDAPATYGTRRTRVTEGIAIEVLLRWRSAGDWFVCCVTVAGSAGAFVQHGLV